MFRSELLIVEGFGKRLRVRYRSVAHKKKKKGIKKKVNDVNTVKGKVLLALKSCIGICSWETTGYLEERNFTC